MQEHLISVVVTTFNRKELLKETLDSIINQTYKNIEILVIDNFSEYNFFEHINSFNDPRIISFQNQNNGIIAINRNFAIKKATGKYVAFCDDDDIWMPEKLENQIKAIFNSKNENNKVLAYTNAHCFGEKIESYNSKKKQINSFNDLILRSDIFFSSIVMTRPILIDFDERIEVVTTEDFKLIGDLFFNNYNFIFTEKPLIKYRITDNSASNINKRYVILKRIYVLIYFVLKYRPKQFNNLYFISNIVWSLIKYQIRVVFKK